MRYLVISSLLGLAACATTQPYDDYNAQREAELRGQELNAATTSPSAQEIITVEELASAGIPVSPDATSNGPLVGPVLVTPAEPVATPGGNPVISDEQDFAAVSSRESIESDRARLEAQREAYRIVNPEPVPQRPSDSGPNIVAFALSTSNQPGERIYSRSGVNMQARFARNCAKYGSPDQAQQAFLAGGGPERDRMTLDPDGDGFACYWDPRPFRAARAG